MSDTRSATRDPFARVMSESVARIPFNRPYVTGREHATIAEAVSRAHLSSDGFFSKQCREWLEQQLGAPSVLLVNSCTAALELSAMLLDLGPGDEVIMPSFTFVTTATAFVLRGATPVFVDIRPDTLNLDEELVDAAITERTKAIVPVHYAGVGCEMEALSAIAEARSVPIVEDAAQGICATYGGRPLGTIGALGAISFHETKNVTSGHGGALVVNDPALIARAEVMRDKGTNRSRFIRGEVDKYTWTDIGSAHALSDLGAAFLWPQLQDSATITAHRRELWERYYTAFEECELSGLLRRPVVPDTCMHNAHMFYLLLPTVDARDRLIEDLEQQNINAVFHYIPLHSSPAGRRYGRQGGELSVTDDVSDRLVRLPLWNGMTPAIVERVVTAVTELLPQYVRGASAHGR
jgi:dTDP-4-amino-4,6-dideoxygalactose transaminase